MPLWGNKDQSITANSTTTVASTTGAPLGTYALVKGGGGPNAHFGNTSGTRAATDVAMFGNTTADAFITGAKVGVFGADPAEVQAGDGAIAHAGWVLRTEGTGGRAGRVHYETLVAMSSVGATSPADASDDAILPDYTLSFTTNPSNASANAAANARATFTVVGASRPTGASLSYFWQSWNGSAWANLSNAGAYSNTTTATLSVLANTASNGEIYRAGVAATGATTVFSSNAVITITT